MTPLTAWQSFSVIVGSSAGALIGLQFVVITLIADMPVTDGTALASSAFATPTIIHFCAALLLSALLNIPWRTVGAAAVACGVWWAFAGSSTRSSWRGVCAGKPHTGHNSRTGCFIFCCPSPPMRRSSQRQTPLAPTWALRYLA